MRQQPTKIWQYQNPDIDTSLTLAAELGITPLVARLLVNRGIKTVEEGKTYLHPTYTDLHSPFDMADMEKAVERIREAIKKGEQICIYGDYDADGTTATALLVNAFRHIDFPVKYYIPDRFDEGYGLNEGAVKEIHKNGCSLMITVDCGITSINEVKLANELDMDVIITDHHQPPENDPPSAYAIISPKVPGNEYPYTDLAGVGLAFKVAQGLIDDEEFLTSLLDLVVLGTVVDIAPLTGENRTLSRLGLTEINKRSRIGIQKLCDVAGLTDKPLVGRSLSFGLGPRLNAAGRLDTAKKVVELLTTESTEIAEQRASELDTCNQDRKNIENDIQESAVALLNRDENFEQTKGLVVASDAWGKQAQGVVGIVASRLLEQYYRPIFVLAIDGNEATGSGRCIDGMNLADSLNSCSNLLIRHGGHKAAAGLTLKTANIPKFKKAFNEFACEHLDENDLIPKLALDFETNLPSLTLETLEQFDILEPFGGENPAPRFVSKDLTVKGQPSLMGKEKQHISMQVSDESTFKRAIGWRKAQHVTTLSRPNISLDIAFSPEINEYNNTRSVQLILEEFHVETKDRALNLRIFPPTDTPSSCRIVDRRNQDKKDCLLALLSKDKPCIIYVPSTDKINQLLTGVVPEKASIIGRHDETTTKSEEIELLEKLKSGSLVGIVSSAVFSAAALETVPIIEEVAFCHLTAQPKDFFLRCKPVANFQRTTSLHLLYNKESDVRLLQEWLEQTYPDRKLLTVLYRKLQEASRTDFIDLEILIETLGSNSKRAIETGITIFEELALLERNTESGQHYIKLLPARESNLERSKTFLKCQWLKQASQDFQKFQLDENIQQIWERIKDEFNIPDSKDSET
ncbi:MAG: single-stranded-DNA-specific exonuclease RecJ [Candidatus Poribacteria bacterium]|nr:single-stranded-DNA-specific exonuclease RecJ [Candidatus Poribacteria bacterium]